jgi:glycosyltransferase involved in cell wall biosynthesis
MVGNKRNNHFFSIIVPTLNSGKFLPTLLKSIKKQKYREYEVLVVDNGSTDGTKKIANDFKAKFITVKGKSPQVCVQRNVGAKNAKGDYLYFVDHDMELSDKFLINFSKKIESPKYSKIDAWYIPEKIIAKSKILSIVRNFEAMFIDGTVVSAARLIKKKCFYLTSGFDKTLSGGPADWDLDIQLKLQNLKFAISNQIVYHHEENLTIVSYILKKTRYIKGEDLYKRKWRHNVEVYKNIVVKQYQLRYRTVGIFIENQKWRKLVRHIAQYPLFLIVKLSMAGVYVYWRNRYAK